VGMSPVDRIRWALRTFGETDQTGLLQHIIVPTSGGDTSFAAPHAMRQALRADDNPSRFTMVFVDTLVHKQPTLDHLELMRARGKQDGYEIQIYRPRVTREYIERAYPEWNTYKVEHKEQLEAARQALKLEPFQRALGELKGDKPRCLISGATSLKTKSREGKPPLRKREDGLYELNFFAGLSPHEIDRYMEENDLPRNREHEDPFKGPDHLECGLDNVSLSVNGERPPSRMPRVIAVFV